ncbi:porin [Hahella aquimaris]|uniref:porin n=1 Tax=Hahella sp. HNIBRBA332 TaxID=3015983 RepID=UPI00273C7F09|nr:porin [Hahella sp. HNIBRBA332]WLQ12224.1 porin [Hahella sp. HNIBRBA332]
MKKTLIASAVAAATISSTTFAMDPASELAARLDSMPTVYGNIQLVQSYVNVDTGAGEASNTDFADNGSTIGFKHKHEIMPGVEGFFKAEFHFDADDQATNKGLGEKFDEAFIGVKGDFGTVLAGSEDTVYEWVDQIDLFESVGVAGDVAGMAESDTLHYYSPSFSGFTVGVTKSLEGGSEYTASVAAKYEMEALQVVLGYAINDLDGGEDVIGLSGSYKFGDFKVIGQFETQDENVDFWALGGVYTMGATQFAAAYGFADFESDEEASEITLQALHNLSDNMYVYVEYDLKTVEPAGGGDDTDIETFNVGATYAF